MNYHNRMDKYYLSINEIGLDEAGRGPLIGNVYAGAVIWQDDVETPNFIKDSKKLSSKKRKIALDWIKDNIKYYSYGYATNEEIDKINILEATKLAMSRAINNLNLEDERPLIIDGIGWDKKFNNVTSIVKGDSKYYSIAAASIIAKEYHDQHIRDLCSENNEFDTKYDLLKNMGYPTKKHIQGIREHGFSEYHRLTFQIKNL
jgi:ribonuclease HII